MDDINIIREKLKQFSDDRDWDQFHNPKDLAIAISVESAELLELFLWKHPSEASRDKVKEELADILAYAFLLANKYDFNIKEILMEKMADNDKKYPVNKSKGNAKKYTEL